MGKSGKKKFIDKRAEGVQHFHVVHRSQQDKAVEYDAKVSDFVLLENKTRENREQRREQQQQQQRSAGASRDHVNSLGLPNDGYDYEQHMKVMGGGTFIAKGGRVASSSLAGAEIPSEALPSDEIVDRHLESVTISEKVMDDDMRAIVMGETEEFEELDDDFMLQAAGDAADDAEPFDYDEHIAKLLAASERVLGLKEGNDASEDEEDEDAEEGSSRVATLLRKEEQRLIDEEFELMLEEYDSDEWGELDENRVQKAEGEADWNLDGNDYVDRCLDDFLASQEGLTEVTDAHRRIVGDGCTAGILEESGAGGGGEVERSAAADDDDEEEEEEEEDRDVNWEPIEKSFEYLKPQEREQWDCETVLSTYTTTDNHPTTLSLPRRMGGRATMEKPRQIELSRKTGLPLGVLRERNELQEEHSGDEEEEDLPRVNEGVARKKSETAEERRQRKAEIKAQRREQREAKKATKGAFKKGAKDASKILAHPELAIRRSVYSYA
jgi:protein LTV1